MKLKLSAILIALISIFALHAQKNIIIDDVYITNKNFKEYSASLYNSINDNQSDINETAWNSSDSSSYFDSLNAGYYHPYPFEFNSNYYSTVNPSYFGSFFTFGIPYIHCQSYLYPSYYLYYGNANPYFNWNLNYHNYPCSYNSIFNPFIYDAWGLYNYTPYYDYMYTPYFCGFSPYYGYNYYLLNTFYSPYSSSNENLRRTYYTPSTNLQNAQKSNLLQHNNLRSNTRLPINPQEKRDNTQKNYNERSSQQNSTRPKQTSNNTYTRSTSPGTSSQTQTNENARGSYYPSTYNSRSNTYTPTNNGISRPNNSQSNGGRR